MSADRRPGTVGHSTQEFLLPHQQHAGALAAHGLVELAGREDRAELSVLEGRSVRWAARLNPHGYDTLTYGRLPARAEATPAVTGVGRPVDLIPSQMAALRAFVHLASQLRVPSAEGLAEQVRVALCDHGIKRWRLHLTEEQIASVAYGFWLHRMTGSAAEANRFFREYGATYLPSPAEHDDLPTGGSAGTLALDPAVECPASPQEASGRR
ncbi:DUF6417 family protein [Streptomyces fagopyri]|uniref:DUF6417 family protein n=1 Tax=Streptomyces fagopyri TaxID=2662397 RepID=UPI0036C6A60A